MASSVDGKIGPAGVDRFASITSQRDLQHLQEVRDEADGILFGAETFRTWPRVHQAKNKAQHAHHFIMSRSLQLDFTAPLFHEKAVSVTIFTPQNLPKNLELPGNTSLIQMKESPSLIHDIVEQVNQLGIKNLLVEGGGQILNLFLSAGLLEELILTLSPRIIGESAAPSLTGNAPLNQAHRLQVLSSEALQDEVFLRFAIKYG